MKEYNLKDKKVKFIDNRIEISDFSTWINFKKNEIKWLIKVLEKEIK